MVAATSGARRRRNPLRTLVSALLVLALLLVLLLVGAALVVQSRLDQDGLRQRIEREVLRQTGRQLTLGGLHVRLLPVPTLDASDVAFANWPAGTQPQMLTAAGVQAHVALLPLLEHVVRLEGVTLTQPDILLERNAEGGANWLMHKQVSTGGDGSASGGAHWRLQIGSVRLLDARLGWQDRLRGVSGAVAGLRLDGSGLAGDRPAMAVSGIHGGAAFNGEIHTGALARLQGDDPSQAPWPLRIDAGEQQDGHEVARLAVVGTVADPARQRGYALDIDAHATRLDALDALFPHAGLPAVAGLSLRTHVTDVAAADAPRGDPELGFISLRTQAFQAGTVLRSRWADDLTVKSLALDARDHASPLVVALDGTWRGQALTVRGDAGTLAAWQQTRAGSGWGPVPLTLDLAVGDARAHVGGTGGSDASDLRLDAKVPALQPILGVGPALTDLVLSARIQTQQGRAAVTLSDLRVDSHQLALAGSATLLGVAHPSLTAALASAHADLDALRSGWVERDAPVVARPSSNAPAAASAPVTGPAPVRPATPFAWLRSADLAIRLDGQDIRLGGETYRDLAAQLAVQDGRLTLAPFSVAGPAGPIAGRLEADAADEHVALTLQPSMIRAETLALLFGQSPVVSGVVELVADLHGNGATDTALVDSATGRIGASLVNGSIANATLVQLAGRSIGLPAGGRTALRCLALPAHVSGGVADIAPLALQTERLDVQGHGTVGLADGRLDLHLLPRLSLGVAGASLPVRVGGTLAAPQAMLDAAGPGGRFTLAIGPGGPAPDICGAALQAARFGAPGPLPGPEAASVRPRKAPKPIDILRGLGLFR